MMTNLCRNKCETQEFFLNLLCGCEREKENNQGSCNDICKLLPERKEKNTTLELKSCIKRERKIERTYFVYKDKVAEYEP